MSRHPRITSRAAVHAVACYYRQHGEDPTTKQVAHLLGVSPAVALRALQEETDSSWHRIRPTVVMADVVDRNYGTVTKRSVPGWAVTREHLCEIIRGLSDRLDADTEAQQ